DVQLAVLIGLERVVLAGQSGPVSILQVHVESRGLPADLEQDEVVAEVLGSSLVDSLETRALSRGEPERTGNPREEQPFGAAEVGPGRLLEDSRGNEHVPGGDDPRRSVGAGQPETGFDDVLEDPRLPRSERVG